MKKSLLLGLMALPLTLGVSTVLLTSCNSEVKPPVDPDTKPPVGDKQDLGITLKKGFTQVDIDNAVIVLTAQKVTIDEKVKALNTLFVDVTSTNIVNFTITTREGNTEPTTGTTLGASIQLRAKGDYTFVVNTLNTLILTAEMPPVVIPPVIVGDLKITNKAGVTQNEINNVANSLAPAIPLPDAHRLVHLGYVFDGVTLDNINNFTIKAIQNSDTALVGSVKLTAKEGFSFNGKPTLDAMINNESKPPVTPEPETPPVVTNTVLDIAPRNDVYMRWSEETIGHIGAGTWNSSVSEIVRLFSPYFTNIQGNELKFTPHSIYVGYEGTYGNIVLTAHDGFEFPNGQTTVMWNPLVNIIK